MKVYIYDAADRISKWGKDAINAFAEGDEQKAMLMGMKRFSKHDAFNAKEARQQIAQKLIDEEKYCF